MVHGKQRRSCWTGPRLFDKIGRVGAVMEAGEETLRKVDTDTKVCPNCAETVKRQAQQCRYCQYKFQRGLPSPSGWLGAIVLLMIGSAVTFFAPRVYNSVLHPLERTDQRFARPWDYNQLLPSLRVGARYKATSCMQTWASSDPTALRCFTAESVIEDPCWASADPREGIACLADPWSNEVDLLTIKSADQVPTANENKRRLFDRPWALELVNGYRCQQITGATFEISGMRVGYDCRQRGPRTASNAYVVGDLDRKTAIWRAHFVKSNEKEIGDVDIKRAWA
jgi:hypothetical protein